MEALTSEAMELKCQHINEETPLNRTNSLALRSPLTVIAAESICLKALLIRLVPVAKGGLLETLDPEVQPPTSSRVIINNRPRTACL